MDLQELAREAAEEITHLLGVGHANDIKHFILHALEAAVGEKNDLVVPQSEVVRSQLDTITDLRAQLESARHGEANLAYDLQHCQMEHQKLSEELEQARKDGDEMERKLRDAELFIESDFIDWAVISKDSPDYDPNYKPEFPAIVKELRAARANYITARQAGGKEGL